MEQRRVTADESIADAFGPPPPGRSVSEESGRGRGGPEGPQARGRTRDSVADTDSDWWDNPPLPRRERIWREREARRAEVGADDPSPSWASATGLWDRVMADIRHMPAEHEAEGWDLATETLVAFRLNLSRRFGLDLDVDLRSGR